MRPRMTLAALLAAACSTAAVTPAFADLRLPRISQDATVTQTVGITDFKLTYSRPGVKSRTIWGELVPYDKPWRTGANEATMFTTSSEITFGGQKVVAGTYTLYTIPSKGDWIVALNRDTVSWGNAPTLDSTKDVVRVKVTPTATESHEWMELGFEDLSNTSANLVLHWEKLAVSVPITVDTNAKALSAAREAIASAMPDDWRTPYQAAGYAFNNDVALDEGWKWLEKSVAIDANYSNQNLMARWHMKAGRKKEAIASAEKAIAAGKASKDKVDTAPTEKLLAEWKAAK